MDFIVENLPIIICAFVGIVLLIIEAFMPGFGLPGITGMLLLITSIVLTWRQHGAYAGLGATLIVMSLTGIVLTLAFKSATTGRLSRSALILKENTQIPENLPDAKELELLIGKSGVAQTVLRPAGIADIEGQRMNVVSRGEFIPKGAAVTVEEVEGTRVVVKRAGENA